MNINKLQTQPAAQQRTKMTTMAITNMKCNIANDTSDANIIHNPNNDNENNNDADADDNDDADDAQMQLSYTDNYHTNDADTNDKQKSIEHLYNTLQPEIYPTQRMNSGVFELCVNGSRWNTHSAHYSVEGCLSQIYKHYTNAHIR